MIIFIFLHHHVTTKVNSRSLLYPTESEKSENERNRRMQEQPTTMIKLDNHRTHNCRDVIAGQSLQLRSITFSTTCLSLHFFTANYFVRQSARQLRGQWKREKSQSISSDLKAITLHTAAAINGGLLKIATNWLHVGCNCYCGDYRMELIERFVIGTTHSTHHMHKCPCPLYEPSKHVTYKPLW